MNEPIAQIPVDKVASLARLKLTEEEKTAFAEQIGGILGYIAVLQDLDTDEVEPMAHAVESQNVFREDLPQPSLSQQEALSNAPKTDGESFLVPPILG